MRMRREAGWRITEQHPDECWFVAERERPMGFSLGLLRMLYNASQAGKLERVGVQITPECNVIERVLR